MDLDLHHGDGKSFAFKGALLLGQQIFIGKVASRQLVKEEIPVAIEIFLIENPKVDRAYFNCYNSSFADEAALKYQVPVICLPLSCSSKALVENAKKWRPYRVFTPAPRSLPQATATASKWDLHLELSLGASLRMK